MIETPLGVLKAAEIAGANPRIAALVLGSSDLANDLHARPTRDRLPLLTALGLVLLAARAHGRAVLDGVHLDLGDADGFAAACPERIIKAYGEALAAGKGAARIEGRLVEALHVEEARRTLALAAAITAR